MSIESTTHFSSFRTQVFQKICSPKPHPTAHLGQFIGIFIFIRGFPVFITYSPSLSLIPRLYGALPTNCNPHTLLIRLQNMKHEIFSKLGNLLDLVPNWPFLPHFWSVSGNEAWNFIKIGEFTRIGSKLTPVSKLVSNSIDDNNGGFWWFTKVYNITVSLHVVKYELKQILFFTPRISTILSWIQKLKKWWMSSWIRKEHNLSKKKCRTNMINIFYLLKI